MKTDCFYVYAGRPVAIEKLLDGDMAEIRHIQRDLDNLTEVVPCSHLTELTQKMAVTNINKLCELRDQQAGKYNMVIHAYEECMRYM